MYRALATVTLSPQSPFTDMAKTVQACLPALSAQVLIDCNRYARDDTGRMIASSYAASDLRRGRLVWNTAYARRVYSTGTPSRKHNAAASLRWCERAKTLHTAAWRALAAKWLGGDAS